MSTSGAKDRGNKGESQRQGQLARGQESSGQESRNVGPIRRQSLSPFGGTEPFQRLRQEFDRLFDRLLPAWAGGGEFRNQGGWSLDVEEDDSSVAVRAEAPGFEPSDFDIQIRGGQLVLSATHKSETESEEGGFREWRRQEFYRSIPLPSEVDPNRVDAMYRNGVLTVTLSKSEGGKGQRIEVKS